MVTCVTYKCVTLCFLLKVTKFNYLRQNLKMFSKGATDSKITQKNYDKLDDYVLENSVLKSKLQSKIAALAIMSREMDKCCMERDRYKVLVEQIKNNKVNNVESKNLYSLSHSSMISGGELLASTREENNFFKLEVETLKSKLEEALGDNVALRKQLQLLESCGANKLTTVLTYSFRDYEDLVQEIEKIKRKYKQLQLDYRATLDEKEEIIQDRDYYKNKVQRLHHQISYIIVNREKSLESGDSAKPVVDLDALMTENKYLHERSTQLQVEKEIIKRTLAKYKSLLENRNKMDKSNSKNGFIDVMTQKQVREYLEKNTKTGLKRSSAAELKSLCLGLFEALNDKSIALQHQRKTNRILANRITELEKTLESWCEGRKFIPIFPSELLIDDSTPETNSSKTEDTKDNHPNNTDDQKEEKDLKSECIEYADSETSDESFSEKKIDDIVYGNSHGNTILPAELQQLVKEALAELNPDKSL